MIAGLELMRLVLGDPLDCLKVRHHGRSSVVSVVANVTATFLGSVFPSPLSPALQRVHWLAPAPSFFFKKLRGLD